MDTLLPHGQRPGGECVIEDYALIGDCETAALVNREGSVDWLCFPRFDSPACFAALLGTPEHGRWLLGPAGPVKRRKRHYRGQTLVLETEHETEEGTVSVIDFMPIRSNLPDMVRIVVGKRGKVRMRMELEIRFDYGNMVPWVRRVEDGMSAVAGPEMLWLRTRAPLHGEDFRTISDFTVSEGERIPFDLTWYPSHRPERSPLDPEQSLVETEHWWQEWCAHCRYEGEWKDAVIRSLITLKALTYAPTGGIVAAPTTSLPEHFGGVRNWDYRYCWLRDAPFTLMSLMNAGFLDEAQAWREWLLRAVAGRPDQIHIMFGIAGERRLPELELPWLPGFEDSRPVRIGNAAHSQFQLDVFGEVMDAMHLAWVAGMPPGENAWRIERALLDYLESAWHRPDEGLWEVRGPRRHFTHSKIMAWVAFDRAIKGAQHFGMEGPIDRWRALRDEIHREVIQKGFDTRKNAFVQYYGSDQLDASLLMATLVGFLPATDPRMRATIEAIERELTDDAFVTRYRNLPELDGLPPGEGAFLLCSFWLVDNLVLLGRRADAHRMFERLLSVCNDLGLLAEGFDTTAGRLTGNFPQAFSHIGLINSAMSLSNWAIPTTERAAPEEESDSRWRPKWTTPVS
jgi:GH15 family glucan-1,4-alpha-glucosidase